MRSKRPIHVKASDSYIEASASDNLVFNLIFFSMNGKPVETIVWAALVFLRKQL